MPDGLMVIFPDFALTRSGTVIHLAVVGYSDRLERFATWLSDVAPAAVFRSTEFDYEAFGVNKETVFDIYDHILRIKFPTKAEAVVFAILCGPDIFAKRPIRKRNTAPLKSRPKAEASKSGLALSPLRSMPIRGDGRGSWGERLPHEVGVAAGLVLGEIDQRAAVIRLGLSGRVALRRTLVRNGWLATWPARAKVKTFFRYG